MNAKQVFFEGHVQGVGFRYSVKQVATGFDVCGWIRNLPDGRVELQAMSDDAEELDAFLQGIRDSGVGGNIRGEEAHVIPPLEGISGFGIR